jgi:hypothetical protein
VARRRIGQLGGILGKYATFDLGDVSASLDVDFEQALALAPRTALEVSLAVTFRSARAPFAQTLARLYERADRSVRAALLNTLLTAVPDLETMYSIVVVNKAGRITPKATDLIPGGRVLEIASSAESMNPSVIDQVSAYYARKPAVLLELDSQSRGTILRSLARAETRSAATRAMTRSVEQPTGSTAPAGEPVTAPSRELAVTGHDSTGALVTAFRPRTRYELRFRVAHNVAGNLAQGDVDVTGVPSAGLAARWVVASNTVDFLAVSHDGRLTTAGATSAAEFDLAIPGTGDSDIVTLRVRTRNLRGELSVTLFVGGEMYRTATVHLDVGARLGEDVVCTAAGHLNLYTTHEWTTPPEHIEVSVFGQFARIGTIRGPNTYGATNWTANSAALANPIQRVRAALEKFWVAAQAHLNDLDTTDMAARLSSEDWKPYAWRQLPLGVSPAHFQRHAALASSSELRALAKEGYALFETCFPSGSDLRDIIAKLEPGSRIDFVWTSRLAVDWVSHVPWALMYLDPLKSTDAVDCEQFLGLRYRIGSRAWEPKSPSRALGDPAVVNTVNLLYWGSNPKDEVLVESQWQRREFAKWPRQTFVPDLTQSDPKTQVVKALENLEPTPAAILYMYCHCSVKGGSDPSLQFGESTKDVVEATDIYQGSLPSAPLVFANACTTLTADPQGTSELERRFFARNIRAFLGTETKVPGVFASRFAWLFFQFFLRLVDPDPMAAGEALAQARRLLWTQYRNPGGLLYSLVNEYDLYLASDQEVRQLSRLRN